MLVNTWEEAQKVLNRLDEAREVVYDAETSGLNPRKNFPCGHVLTFGPKEEDTFYIPVRHRGGGNLPGLDPIDEPELRAFPRHDFEVEMVRRLARPGLVTIGHAIGFDLGFLGSIGFAPDGEFRDTLINAYLINELRPSFSLDACCKSEHVTPKRGEPLYAYMAEQFGGAAKRGDQMKNYWRTDAREKVVWDYAVGDGTSTWELNAAQMKKIYREDEKGSLEKIWKLESDLIPILAKIEAQGIRVNLEQAARVREHFEGGFKAAMDEIGGINVRAPTQIIEFLKSRGIDEFPKTPKGNISFTEDWLKTHEPGQAIVRARKFRTIVDNYIVPLLEEHLIGDRFYPSYNQTRGDEYGTITGRLSSNGPNITAYPGKRQKENGKVFRTMFVPDDGLRWVERDYASCEIRIATHYCNAATWRRAFEEGISPHQTVADDLNIEYAHAKAIDLGLMTGMGKKALASHLGLPLQEGVRVVDRFFKGLPELSRWQRKAKDTFRQYRYVKTLAGRRLRLDDPRFAYRGVNRLTQGGNADIIKSAMVRIYNETGVIVLMNIHDSLSWQSDDPKLDAEIERIMCDTDNEHFKMRVPLAVEGHEGRNWSEASFGHD